MEGDSRSVKHWYQQDTEQTLESLQSSLQGLEIGEVERRLVEYGPNELLEREGRPPWQIVWEQLREPMVLLLIVAAGVSILIHEYLDAAAIGIIVVLNAVLGFVQEYRAEKAMAALKQLAVPEVKVRRGGAEATVSAIGLVPGDVVLLQAGNRVPADCRVVESRQLRIQEAALTGESQGVTKKIEALNDTDLPLGDQTNMVFMGTEITTGRGEAMVTQTGMRTELGKIADMIQDTQVQRTPLQRRLARMGIWLAVAALGIVVLVFVLGVLRGQELSLLVMTALSMAVAAVPEGLPAVATIALALGAKRMLRRDALIRKLPAVETLGSVTVICSDKTGTLTENRMRLSVLRYGDFELDVQEHLGDQGVVRTEDDPRLAILDQHPSLALALLAGALCNDAHLVGDGDSAADEADARLQTDGDPTEGALVTAAARFGLTKPQLDIAFARVTEAPFDSVRKRMTTVHRVPDADSSPAAGSQVIPSGGPFPNESYLAVLKGAMDSVLEVCTHVWTPDGPQPMRPADREAILVASDRLAAAGKRVLGIAVRGIDALPDEDSVQAVEKELTFLAMAGLIDPPRKEAADAVRRCKSAGIRPVMITGDHPLTAQYIARLRWHHKRCSRNHGAST